MNNDGDVTALDALRVINHLARSKQHGSGESPLGAAHVFADVNSDGAITALDALIVINHVAANRRSMPSLASIDDELIGQIANGSAIPQSPLDLAWSTFDDEDDPATPIIV